MGAKCCDGHDCVFICLSARLLANAKKPHTQTSRNSLYVFPGLFLRTPLTTVESELDTDWMHPWIGLDWVGLDWIGSNVGKLGWIGLDWIAANG